MYYVCKSKTLLNVINSHGPVMVKVLRELSPTDLGLVAWRGLPRLEREQPHLLLERELGAVLPLRPLSALRLLLLQQPLLPGVPAMDR